MTEKQMKAFLKVEGWKRISLLPLGSNQIKWIWMDPRDRTCWQLPVAYATASRRKRQREAARLRRAGWAFDSGMGFWDCGDCLQYTREAALQTLEAQP